MRTARNAIAREIWTVFCLAYLMLGRIVDGIDYDCKG